MNRVALVIAVWVGFGLEMGLKDVLAIGTTGMAPSFVVPLAVYVALHAPARMTFWTTLLIGLVIDLTSPVDLAGGGAAVIAGPYALGLMLGGQLVLSLRGVFIRENFLTLGVLTLTTALLMHVFVVAVYVVHELYGDPILIDAGDALLKRAGASVYSGVAALPLAFLLAPLGSALGFAPHARQRFSRH